jgi:hypothetical protein
MRRILIALCLGAVMASEPCSALTANQVWFEFHGMPHVFYRVRFQYTLPEIRELREAYADFYDKRKADKFYSDLLHGADFYLGESGQLQFVASPAKRDPW